MALRAPACSLDHRGATTLFRRNRCPSFVVQVLSAFLVMLPSFPYRRAPFFASTSAALLLASCFSSLQGDYEVPLGQARIAREGSDVTIVSWGQQVLVAELAVSSRTKWDNPL